jgi:ribosomal protein L7/L12
LQLTRRHFGRLSIFPWFAYTAINPASSFQRATELWLGGSRPEEVTMSKFLVRVISPGSNVVPRVKTLRLVADLGLAEAKGLSDYLRDHTPCVLVAGVSREVADHAAELLRKAGAEVAVEESSLDAPMLLCPEADHRYRWSFLSGPVPV